MSNSWSLVVMTEPTVRDVQLDEWIFNHPDSLVVFGAGNDGFVDGAYNKGSIQSPATSKTAMTVGANNNGPGRAYAYYETASSNYDGVMWPHDDVSFEVCPYSARGPVGDAYTAKPEVLAPGVMVHSARASMSEEGAETCSLDSLGGTSMSAPAVAGAAALVRQYFRDGVLADYLTGAGLCDEEAKDLAYVEAGLCEGFEPSGYLVKAVLVNSAVWLGDMQTVSYGKYGALGAGRDRCRRQAAQNIVSVTSREAVNSICLADEKRRRPSTDRRPPCHFAALAYMLVLFFPATRKQGRFK